jgi:hypothetical protein
MRDAQKRIADGQDGGLLLLAFEQALTAEIEGLRKKAFAAQERFYCFKHQIEDFGRADFRAEVQPERGAAAGTGQEPPRAVKASDGTKVGPAEKTTAGGDQLPKPGAPYLFALLPDGRYRITYAGKGDTLPGLAGLRVVEYLLKQPGKAVGVMAINRALHEGNPRAAGLGDAFAGAGEQRELDGFTADERQPPDPCSQEDLEKAREAVKSLEDQAEKAWTGGEHDKAEELDRKAEVGRKWVRRQERLTARKSRGQPDEHSEVQKVRVKLTNNFANALEKLRTEYGWSELADHLDEQIDRGSEWKYRPVAGVDWLFDAGVC